MIDQPEPLPSVDGTLEPATEELKDKVIGTSAVTPGNVINRSVSNALPEPTSTDTLAAPDTPKFSRVALLRAPAAGAGFGVTADAGAAVTTAAVKPAATTAATVSADEHRRARITTRFTVTRFHA